MKSHCYQPSLKNNLDKNRYIDEKIKSFLKIIKPMSDFDKVEFIILHGSAAKGEMIPGSDIDMCVYYNTKEKEALSRFRLDILTKLDSSVYDIQMFQQLPLYVRIEILKGKVIFVKDQRFVYDVALDTIKEYESFKPRFHDYIYR